MSKDFVWNEAQAEQVRAESEQAMRQQIENMQATGQTYRGWIPVMDAQAREQEHIAATAMRTVRTLNGSRRVPDWPRRAEAARRAASLREQIGLTSQAASNIDRAIADLEIAILETNRHFWRMRNEAQALDMQFSKHIQAVDNDIETFIATMQSTNDSFSENGFTANWKLEALEHVLKLSEKIVTEGLKQTGKGLANVGVLLRTSENSVGRSFARNTLSQNPLDRLYLRVPDAINNVSPNMRYNTGIAVGGLGRGMTAVSVATTFSGYHDETQDVGRAIAFTGFVEGTAFLAGAGTAVVIGAAIPAAPVVVPVLAVAVVGYGVGLGAVWLYNNNDGVREVVHRVGDGINAAITASTPAQAGALTSEFWTPEILSFHSDGTVGQAISSDDWINRNVEERCGD